METKNNEDSIANVGGAKQARQKNGHKMTCSCHICENILNKAKRGDYKPKAASGKVNGHKSDCYCPICKNMMAKKEKRGGEKRGGEKREGEKQAITEEQSGGRRTRKHGRVTSGKKSNGHKVNCMCPICRNMRRSRMSRRNNTRSKKNR